MVGESSLHFDIAAFGSAEARPADIVGLRRSLTIPGVTLEPSFLKNADDQTVVAFAALQRAFSDFDLSADSLTRWSVIGAPRFVGRPIMPFTMTKYTKIGVNGVSVHIIPHQSLHSLSGAVSLALRTHGPNFGVGGGPGALAEGFLAAMTQGGARSDAPPSDDGVLLFLTEWDPEPVPDESGAYTNDVICHALVLAIRRPANRPRVAANGQRPLQIHLDGHHLDGHHLDGHHLDGQTSSNPASAPLDGGPASSVRVRELAERIRELARGDSVAGSPTAWCCELDWGATLRLAS